MLLVITCLKHCTGRNDGERNPDGGAEEAPFPEDAPEARGHDEPPGTNATQLFGGHTVHFGEKGLSAVNYLWVTQLLGMLWPIGKQLQ
jgi:hypothetical protein